MLTPVYLDWSGWWSQVRGADPKGVKVTRGFGYQTSMLCVMCPGWG